VNKYVWLAFELQNAFQFGAFILLLFSSIQISVSRSLIIKFWGAKLSRKFFCEDFKRFVERLVHQKCVVLYG
jgi:hypothetical protein